MNIVFHEFEENEQDELLNVIEAFDESMSPLESDYLLVLKDEFTGAAFCECHLRAGNLIKSGTTDVPLDPENAPEYRANRELATSHAAFERMKQDAVEGRVFSNLVCEYRQEASKPLEVIGGQHRFDAISEAFANGVDQFHGLKVYFSLTNEQRLDVQVISNTNITVPADLLDRMFATIEGTDLRQWCQRVGLLDKGQDFADKNKRDGPITVKEARTLIVNYFMGREVGSANFENRDTTPKVVKSGTRSPIEWASVLKSNPDLWDDAGLKKAGKEFAKLVESQLAYFWDAATEKYEGKADQRHKAKNMALLSAWSFVSGALSDNSARLKRHYLLSEAKREPLRSDLLAKGRHQTDADNYRGLGFRTDPKERGRFAQLFWLQAEKGGGFTTKMVDSAIKGYEAKKAQIEYQKSKDSM